MASLPPWLEPQVRISHPRSNKEASLCLPTPSFWGRQEPCHPLEKPTYSCPQEPFKGVKKKKKKYLSNTLMAQMVKNPPAMWFHPWVGKNP